MFVMTQRKAAHAKVVPEYEVTHDTRTRYQALDNQA